MRTQPIQRPFFAALLACALGSSFQAADAIDQAEWWTQAGRFIRDSEYHVVGPPTDLRYSNRAQRLGVDFQDGDAIITPWKSDGPTWSIRLESETPYASSGAPTDIIAGDDTIVWRNQPAGIELEFSALPVVLRVQPDLGLSVHVGIDGDVLRWYSAGRPVLEMRSAEATRIRLVGNSITIEGAGDNGNLWITGAVQSVPSSGVSDVPDWIGEGNGTVARFGAAVATAGDFNDDGYSDVIVGAPDFGALNRGRVFLFRGSADGLETIPIWIVDGESDGSKFGATVAGAGDVNDDGFDDLLIGAPLLSNESTSVGRAYVFLGGSPQPDDTADWTYTGEFALDQFGASVAAAGDVNGDGCTDVVIGAPASSPLPADGHAFLFRGCSAADGGLTAEPSWVAGIDEPGAQFGASVGGAGDVNADGYADVIVGAPFFGRTDDVARRGKTTFNEGQAVVYLGSAAGLAASPSWVAFGGASNATFGTAVAGAGDVNGDGYADVIVGAPAINVASGGSAHLFAGNATGVAESRLWTGAIGQSGDNFGRTVATGGDVNGDGYADVLVGAPAYNGGEPDEGATFLYYGGQDGPRETPDWAVEGDLAAAELGHAAGTAGDVNDDGYSDLLIGAPGFAVNAFSGGRAFAYFGAPRPPAETDSWNVVGTRYRLGWSVATAGDFNGDGFSDVLISEAAGSRASLWAGSADGLSRDAPWGFRGSIGSDFGWIVGTAGDVNGDGLGDILFGAPNQSGRGAVFVFHGGRPPGPLLTSATADWDSLGDPSDQLGRSAAFAGDVNGDGFGDLIAGAPGAADGGRVYVWLGSADGLSESYDWTAESPLSDASFGDAAASAGDVNGDGFGDVIVGAFTAESNRGLAVVYLGSPNGLSSEPTWQARGMRSGERFGEAVASTGDLNGDGFSDIVVGAPTNSDLGRVYVYLGSPSGPSLVHDWMVSATVGDTRFGSSVAAAGDVNGDGFGDLAIGEYEGSPAAAYVYAGSPSGPGPVPLWTGTATTASNFGFSVATAGDVDGDGVADLLVGARGVGTTDPGQAYLFAGNPGARRARRLASTGGLSRPARQFLELEPSTPIDIYGLSDSSMGFVVDAVGRTAAGRGTIESRIEVSPVGTAFENALEQSGAPQDTGAPTGAAGSAVTFRHTIDSLAPTTFVHWRIRFMSDSLFFPTSPWRSVPWNGITETKLRTAGPPAVSDLRPIGPGSNEPVFPDSAPLIFSWNRGPHTQFRLEWSSTTAFVDRLEVSSEQVADPAGGDVQVFIPDADLWQRILLLGRNADVRQVPIFWRVVPLDGPTASAPVAISAIRMAPPLSPVLLSPANGVVFPDSQSPILNWQENHNDRYRVVFSRTPGMEEPRVTSTEVSAPPLIDWDDTWAEVVELARQGDGRIYWAVFAEDAIGRITWSDVRNFRILFTSALESR